MNLNDLSLVLHHIKVKLYPNNLKNVEGAYIARTNSERTLDVEDICAIMKTRAGFAGKYEDLLNNIRQYNDEVAYQLCDGYAVTNGWFTAYPNIGGAFDSANEAHDHEKHPVSFRFSPRARLRNIAKEIAVDIEGLADTNGSIYTFTDFDENAVNSIFASGDQFAIHGSKIKVEGTDPGIGVFFVPVDNPTAAVKVARIAENNPSKITGICPQTGYQNNRIEIRTQFTGSTSILLKAPRIITSTFILEEA